MKAIWKILLIILTSLVYYILSGSGDIALLMIFLFVYLEFIFKKSLLTEE